MNKPLIYIYISALFLAALASCASAKTIQKAQSRNLTGYLNDNGKPPTGLDSKADDTSAMRKALAGGPGIVYIGPGYYRFSGVSIPSGVTVVGAGAATIIRPAGARQIIEQKDVNDWAIRDVLMDGEAQGDWHQRRDLGDLGISIQGCGRYDVTGVVLRNFNGSGLWISGLNPSFMGGGAGNLERISCYGNHTGIHFAKRAEYENASMLSCYNNIIGCAINSGNVKISNSNFGANVDGMIIEDNENGSHGAISNCLMNHNERYALFCKDVTNGMSIVNCCFFYGTLRVENSVGINIADGIIGCSVSVAGAYANRISGNYIIPDQYWKYDIDQVTIVQGNFTKDGQWSKNAR